MSAISRFGPSVAKNLIAQQHRQMATAVSVPSDPIQKLFLEKIKDFKTSNKGLDDQHKKLLSEEMSRLKRVYNVDENNLAVVETKFANETNVSLHDLDTSKEMREKIYSGEYQKQVAIQSKPKSALMESIKHGDWDEWHLPLINKPHKQLILDDTTNMKMNPPKIADPKPDYMITSEKVTPESLQRDLRVSFGEKMPTIDDEKSPQRDTVNFPRIPVPLDTPPTVGHIIPASWFNFFHPKTGKTGGYVFGFGFTTFLLSKEWLVVEHEFISGISLIPLFAWLITKFGPKISGFIRADVQHKIDEWDRWQKGSIETLGKIKTMFDHELSKGKLIDDLYEARKQDVDLQLEYEYRKRLNSIYSDTKRRLNYLVAVADSQRQISQAHMVNWVISNVHKSIGPKQEEEYLASCIGNLKQLAQKNAFAI